MNLISNIFSFTKNRKSIPNSWCGLWVDKNKKQIVIKPTKHDFYTVSIFDDNKQPYKIDLLGDKVKNTTNLIGRFAKDTYGNPILQAEAGSNDIGPTYNLHFLTFNKKGELRLAKNSDILEEIILKPNVGMGLYDDWEDDLGVPWAFPLEDFKFKES